MSYTQSTERSGKLIKSARIGFTVSKLLGYSADLPVKASIISDLAEEIWREHYTPIIGAEQVEYMLKKYQSAEQILTDISENEYIYCIASETQNDKPIGYSAVAPQESRLFLSKLYVLKEYRGRGVATALLDEAITLCRHEYKFDSIILTVNKNNKDAIAAYNKMGFITVRELVTDIGAGFYMDDYQMELKIRTV